MRINLKKLTLVVLSLTLTCCSSSTLTNPFGLGSSSESYPTTEPLAPTRGLERYPWEMWVTGRDLESGIIGNNFIVKADQLVGANRRKEALLLYNRAKNSELTPREQEALILRIASTQLATDQATEALQTLSEYSRKRALRVQEVDPRFAVVFAYAYGRTNNYEQSLAWFSQLYNESQGKGTYAIISSNGLLRLLSSLSEDQLNTLSEKWGGDLFVFNSIREERRKRVMGVHKLPDSSGRPFWEQPSISNRTDPLLSAGSSGGKVAALLPLTGKYSKLGKSTKNGLELALTEADSKVRVDSRDSGGTAYQASQEVLHFFERGNPSVIVGPLLSDEAEAVMPLVEDYDVPVLTFSRREGSYFGKNVFRLGATVSSQISSLVSAAVDDMRFNRVAVVFPETQAGYEAATEFRKQLSIRGLQPELEYSYDPNDRDGFVPIVEQLEASNIQALFFPDDLDKAVVFVSNFSPLFKKRVRMLGLASWDNTTELARARTLLDGAIFVSPFFKNSKREIVSRFRTAYKSRYKKDPDFLAAQGFDAGTMVLAALDRQIRDQISFEESFRGIASYNGLTGQISVLPNGEVQRFFTVVTLKDSKVVDVAQDLYDPTTPQPIAYSP